MRLFLDLVSSARQLSPTKYRTRLYSTMTTLFDDIVPPGVSNLRMGAPGDKILLKSAELVKNAAQKVMVSTS